MRAWGLAVVGGLVSASLVLSASAEAKGGKMRSSRSSGAPVMGPSKAPPAAAAPSRSGVVFVSTSGRRERAQDQRGQDQRGAGPRTLFNGGRLPPMTVPVAAPAVAAEAAPPKLERRSFTAIDAPEVPSSFAVVRPAGAP